MSEQQNGHSEKTKRVHRVREDSSRGERRPVLSGFARDELAIDWRHYMESRLEDFARR